MMWQNSGALLKLLNKPAVGAMLVALALAAPGMLRACGIGYAGDDYRVALLDPRLAGYEFAPFYYATARLYPKDLPPTGSDRRRNCAEWAAYMNTDLAQVQEVLYGSSLSDLENALTPEGAAGTPLAYNAFWKALLRPDKKAVLEYVLLAKRYEYHSNRNLQQSNPWVSAYNYYYGGEEEETASSVKSPIETLRELAEGRLKSVNDPFLKRRYAYQSLVMARYANDRPRFNAIWSEHFAGINGGHSALYDWALHHRSAMVDNEGERTYLLALSFMSCPEKRVYTYDNFDLKQLGAARVFARQNEEKAHLEAVAALKKPGRVLTEIKTVASLYPNHPLLPLLLIREVNKLEDWLLSDQVTGLGPAYHPGRQDFEQVVDYEGDYQAQWAQFRAVNRQKDEAYLAEVEAFVRQLKPGALSADLHALLQGHLAMLRKDNAAAHAAWAGISRKADAGIKTQLSKGKLLAMINDGSVTEAGNQRQVLAWLQQIAHFSQESPDHQRDLSVVYRMISQAFTEKKQFREAYLINNMALGLPTQEMYGYYSNYYSLLAYLDVRGQESEVDAVLALMEKRNPSDWERWLLQASMPSKEALLDLRGTLSLRKGNYAEALKAFEQIDPSFWRQRYAFSDNLKYNPFAIRALDDAAVKGFPGDKVSLVRELLQLETQTRQPAKAAEAHARLGIAWYNFSYFGNSWMMFSYGRGSYDGEANSLPYLPHAAEMKNVYFNMTRAEEHLTRALAANPNQELAARAAFVLGRIEEMRRLSKKDAPSYWEEEQWKAWVNQSLGAYDAWKQQYGATSTFRTVVAHCPELARYFGK